jgi:predicted XRE-type DNA-binding protein
VTDRIKRVVTRGNVFEQLDFDPAEAESLRLRAELMRAIEAHVTKSGLSQAEAAKTLGVSQPRLNDLLRGRIGKFSLDALVKMLAATGRKVQLTVRKAA